MALGCAACRATLLGRRLSALCSLASGYGACLHRDPTHGLQAAPASLTRAGKLILDRLARADASLRAEQPRESSPRASLFDKLSNKSAGYAAHVHCRVPRDGRWSPRGECAPRIASRVALLRRASRAGPEARAGARSTARPLTPSTRRPSHRSTPPRSHAAVSEGTGGIDDGWEARALRELLAHGSDDLSRLLELLERKPGSRAHMHLVCPRLLEFFASAKQPAEQRLWRAAPALLLPSRAGEVPATLLAPLMGRSTMWGLKRARPRRGSGGCPETSPR